MKFALAVDRTRGGVEPRAAVSGQQVCPDHQARRAVPPNLVGLVESPRLAAVAYAAHYAANPAAAE